MRKCEIDKHDYTFETGGAAFPMRVHYSGSLYGFCPGKATWQPYLLKVYDILALSCELSVLPYKGNIFDQPDWVISNLSWFSRKYNHLSQLTRSGMMSLTKTKPKKDKKGQTNGTK